MTGTQGVRKMFIFTAFITNILKKKVKKKKKFILSFPTVLLQPSCHLTPDPFLQGQFKTEPVHCRFHRKQPVPGMWTEGWERATVLSRFHPKIGQVGFTEFQ